jgi:hypothetical protein
MAAIEWDAAITGLDAATSSGLSPPYTTHPDGGQGTLGDRDLSDRTRCHTARRHHPFQCLRREPAVGRLAGLDVSEFR